MHFLSFVVRLSPYDRHDELPHHDIRLTLANASLKEKQKSLMQYFRHAEKSRYIPITEQI